MFTLVGALTSKPYAFVSRPWEITSSEGIDFFDSFLSSIRIDERGLKVIRILPSIDSTKNGDWISDRVRFFYNFQDNQRVVDNIIFYDNNKIFVSNSSISMLIFLSFSKNSSFIYNFGVPTPYEFQNFFLSLSSLFNFNYLNISNNTFDSDFRSNYIPKNIKNIFNNVTNSSFFILNFNTRFSFPIFNIFCRSEFSRSVFPVFYFGSSYYSNFRNVFNFGSNIYNFFKIITFKNKINKIVKDSSSFSFISPSSYFSRIVNTLSINKKIKDTTTLNSYLNFNFFDYDSSSIISSEINFKNFGFRNDKSACIHNINKDIVTVSFNSSQNFNVFPAKFNINFESNFDFYHTDKKENVTDFLISFPSIFSYSSTFLSIDGFFKNSNSYKKLDNITDVMYTYFSTFSSSFGFSKSFFDVFCIFSKSKTVVNVDYNFNELFSNNSKSIFIFKSVYSSDSFYSKESARSHYLRSPLTRYSIPLVLHYSRLKNNLFNHN
jgi:NADH-quinone oxidoreductase subunit G